MAPTRTEGRCAPHINALSPPSFPRFPLALSASVPFKCAQLSRALGLARLLSSERQRLYVPGAALRWSCCLLLVAVPFSSAVEGATDSPSRAPTLPWSFRCCRPSSATSLPRSEAKLSRTQILCWRRSSARPLQLVHHLPEEKVSPPPPPSPVVRSLPPPCTLVFPLMPPPP